MTAIFEFTDQTFVEAFWNVPIRPSGRDPLGGDFLAVLYRDDPSAPWRLTCRMRTYRDEKAWGSQDERESFEITPKDDPTSDAARDRLGVHMDAMTAELASIYRTQVVKRRVQGNGAAFSRVFSTMPFAHVKVLPRGPERPQ